MPKHKNHHRSPSHWRHKKHRRDRSLSRQRSEARSYREESTSRRSLVPELRSTVHVPRENDKRRKRRSRSRSPYSNRLYDRYDSRQRHDRSSPLSYFSLSSSPNSTPRGERYVQTRSSSGSTNSSPRRSHSSTPEIVHFTAAEFRELSERLKTAEERAKIAEKQNTANVENQTGDAVVAGMSPR